MRIETFHLVDRVEELRLADGYIRCRATVPEAASIFEGHFPGHPLMPGVLLVESMAQTSGQLLLAHHEFTRMVLLAEIRSAKFRRMVPPGTLMSVAGKLVHDGSGYAVTEGAITVDGKAVAEAELRFRTLPFPSEETRAAMRDYALSIGLIGG
jgi:3-hydroxyacyl-[acyl-carrier-protein] dehydratase